MGILKSAADLVYTIRFLKLLVTPFEKTGAYEAGIIDEKGNLNKEFTRNSMDDREAWRTHYTSFHRLVYNIKKLMAKVPGGSSRIASYAAALYLIKEHGELSDSNIQQIHEKTEIDILDILAEGTEWYLLENKQLSPGVYRVRHEMMTDRAEDIVKKNDPIRITEENSFPVGQVLGIDIYKATHLKTNRSMYVSNGDITK